MKRNCRDIVCPVAFAGFLIQRLNITESVRKSQAGDLNFVGRQSIKHECIIGIGTMGNGDFASADGAKAGHLFFSRKSTKT